MRHRLVRIRAKEIRVVNSCCISKQLIPVYGMLYLCGTQAHADLQVSVTGMLLSRNMIG